MTLLPVVSQMTMPLLCARMHAYTHMHINSLLCNGNDSIPSFDSIPFCLFYGAGGGES